MTVDAIFAEAIAKRTAAERTAYLDLACANDLTMRQRVETLLQAHEAAGDFLGKPAIQCAAEELAGPAHADDTQGEAPLSDGDPEPLDFLALSDKPGALGRLGHYEVLEVIGRGGMGMVLKAFDEQLHRNVAIKVMAPQLATNALARKRFVREARAAAAVRNEHVIDIHAVVEANDLPYLAMEYVAGVSLQERLDQNGPLSLGAILRIGMQTAAGLAAAHAQGLIHRDIKPSNILLENGVERVKITDFGLARAVDDVSLTQSGVIAGTPQYMSPEQARGEAVDHRADLFSLGSVMYAMCTGRAPFRASGTMAVLKRVCEDTPRVIREVNPETPDWLSAIIARLQAKDPADRFQSAAEVAELLSQHLAHLQQPALAPMPDTLSPLSPLGLGAGGEVRSRTQRGRRRAIAAAVSLCFVAGLSLTEATRVTNLRATVIGIFTPDGTLVVETAAKAEKSAFVLLSGKGALVWKHDTLTDAVREASDGDTIEVRGNGPFVTEPVNIGDRALVIRAGAGFRPVIELSAAGLQAAAPVLATDARLVLEGLELRRMVRIPWKDGGNDKDAVVYAPKAPLYVGNCRLLTRHHQVCGCGPSVCSFLNCEVLCSNGLGVVTELLPGSGLIIENCVQSYFGIGFPARLDHQEPASIRLTHNTCIGKEMLFSVWLVFQKESELPFGATKRVRVAATGNVFHAGRLMDLCQMPWGKIISPRDVETYVKQELDWRGRQNLYAFSNDFLVVGSHGAEQTILIPAAKGLAGWKQFWTSAEADSVEGRVRFQGGDVLTKLRVAPETVTPDDFRLHPDSPGYKAAKDGKDLGADVDLVGPGPAYERWKKTPAYQQWLQETGQFKKADAADPKSAKLSGPTPPVDAKLLAELAGYEATLEENPNDLGTLLKRGEVLFRVKRFDDAVAAFSQVIMNTSNQAERKSALLYRAVTHAERGHLQGTIEDYEEYLRQGGSEAAWVYGRLATCYTFGPEKLRNPKRALEHAETAIQKRDANASFHTLHGACLYRLGRHREAIAVLERIYESTSTTKEGPTAMNRFFAAMTYQSLGDPAKAKECYALALNLPQPTGYPGMIPAWVELMRAEAEAVLKIPTKK